MYARTILTGILLGLLASCGGGGGGHGGYDDRIVRLDPDPMLPDTGATLEIEPNDGSGTAMALSVPDRVTGTVNLASDEFDYFVFALDQAATIAIDLNGEALGADLDLALYDQNGALIGMSAGDGADEHIEVLLDAGVAYYIEVEAFDTLGQASSYTLDVSLSAAPQPFPST